MLRSFLVSFAVVCAAFSHAAFIQKFNKVMAIGGHPISWTDVLVTGNDFNSAEVYAWGTVSNGTDLDVVLAKINSNGTTAYLNRIPLPGDQRSGNLAYGDSKLFGSYSTGSLGDGVVLRRFKPSTGASEGTLTYADPNAQEFDSGSLQYKYPAAIYWAFTKNTPQGRRLAIAYVANGIMQQAVVNEIVLPAGHELLSSALREAGPTYHGPTYLIGSTTSGVSDSDIYVHNWGSSGTTISPIGHASALAVQQSTGTSFAVGASNTAGLLTFSQTVPFSPLGGYTQHQGMGGSTIREAVVTKQYGNMIGAGTTDNGGTSDRNSFMCRFDSENGGTLSYSTFLPGGPANEQIVSLRRDGYDGFYALETNDTNTNSRVLEVNALTGVLVEAKTYPSQLKAFDTSYYGFTVAGGDQGRIVMLQARDLREIYYSPTGAYTGNLIINMYQTHGIDRIVALADNSPNLSLPAGKTVLAGSMGATAAATTLPVTSTEVVTITASYAGQTRICKFTLNP